MQQVTPAPSEGVRQRKTAPGLHLYLVDDHGFIGKVHDRLGHGECEGTQPCAIATNQDESLHSLERVSLCSLQ